MAIDPVQTINAAVIGINALLQVIANLRAQTGLTDDQLADMFKAHGQETHDAIQGYLSSLPPA